MLGQYVERERKSALMRQAREQGVHWLRLPAAALADNYNRRPFLLTHRLAEHPDFNFDSLFALCRRLPEEDVRVRIGKVPDDAEFDTSLRHYNQGLALDDAIAHFEERQAYIAVYNPERDPHYRTVLEGLLGEIMLAIEPVDAGLNWYSTYLFLSTSGSVTPYHMDREMNFLFQIRGRKTVRLWDPSDDEVMTPEQRDRLLAEQEEIRPAYRPELEAKAMKFELEPGTGVHHPFIAPHLVKTHDALSITLAITFRSRDSDRWTDAHKLNHRLRKLGLNPTPIRLSPARDAIKATLIGSVRSVRRWVGRGPKVPN